MAISRSSGVSLTDIEQTFGVDRRTAQRMTKALKDVFPNCITQVDDDRRKFWTFRSDDARLILAQGLRDSEIAALGMAIRQAEHKDLVLRCTQFLLCVSDCCLRCQAPLQDAPNLMQRRRLRHGPVAVSMPNRNTAT